MRWTPWFAALHFKLDCLFMPGKLATSTVVNASIYRGMFVKPGTLSVSSRLRHRWSSAISVVAGPKFARSSRRGVQLTRLINGVARLIKAATPRLRGIPEFHHPARFFFPLLLKASVMIRTCLQARIASSFVLHYFFFSLQNLDIHALEILSLILDY